MISSTGLLLKRPGLAAPGFAVDLASGARRVVALMEHSRDNGAPNILESCTLPVDGARCVSLIVTDTSAIRVTDGGLELAELAPGWTADDVAALTGGSLSVSSGLREMTFDVPALPWPNKVYASAAEALARRAGRGRGERGRLWRAGRDGPQGLRFATTGPTP